MRLAAILLAITLGTPAAAQEVIGEYFARMGPNDFFNSRGARLTDPCAIIQQDRANYHRFGKADGDDWGDPFFGNRETRALISSNCQIAAGSEYIADRLRNGEVKYLYIRVLGSGSRVTGVLVSEGAG